MEGSMLVYAKNPNGIMDLDEELGLNTQKNNITLIIGEPGTGKTTLALQSLYLGNSIHKEKGMFITFEEEKKNLYKNAKNFNWDFDKLEKEKSFLCLEYLPQEADHFLAQEVVIHDVINKLNIKRIVIDSLTSFSLLFETDYKKRLETVKLISRLKKWGCNALLTYNTTNLHNLTSINPNIEVLVDGLIYLHNQTNNVKMMDVIKLRGVNFKNNQYKLYFTPKGMAVKKQ